MSDPLLLAPGVRRLRPDDHFMVLAETDASPMHVGALLILDVPEAEKPGIAHAWRRQLAERLPATPLQVRLAQAPDGYDSDVWAQTADVDLDVHVVDETMPLAGDEALYAAVAERNMVRLDLARAPFIAHVFANLPGDRAAIYLKVHHSVADGLGFQEILRLLSDETAPAPARTAGALLPTADEWRTIAEQRFAEQKAERNEQAKRRKEALAALQTLKGQRAETPQLKLSGKTSNERSYTVVSLPVDRFKAVAHRYRATVNDLFLACASGTLREYLLEVGDLPEGPIVVNSARSYRREEHGAFGNRIVALHPHLATHLADPVERLQAIRQSMADEMERTEHDEALLDRLEKPFGARDRRAAFAAKAGGGRVLPGNITLSNVPGPSSERRFAGYRQRHNYPVPIIGSGRFLNITSRRSGDNLDMGVIADAEKIGDIDKIARAFVATFEAYENAER